jgi:outer membrane protein assembly factor BamB
MIWRALAVAACLAGPVQAQSLTAAFLAPAPPRLPYVEPASVGQPFPGAKARGLLAFRGNPTRTWYGTGPLPNVPGVLWKVGPYCGPSTDEQGTRTWCGTGWTGQPAVRVLDGRTEVIFGAYDHQVHFLDAGSGADVRAPFRTGDIIKGSVSLDPTGAPFLYFGSRDNFLRVLRLDEGKAVEVWRLNAVTSDGVWNNDWDGNPLILGDYLLTGSENSWFYAVRLNRGRDAAGQPWMKPEVANRIPGFTPQLFRDIGDQMVSIETSVMAIRDRVYFANSGGLVQGYLLRKLLAGASREEAQTFEFHVGDDLDATLVADADGMIYAAIEDERRASAAKTAAGQLVKLDPSQPGNPVVWSLRIPGRTAGKGGLWATPALAKGHLYVTTHVGGLLTVDTVTGAVTSDLPMPWHGWSSPVVIGNELLVADCDGAISKFSLADPAQPFLIWRYAVPGAGCWESTPAVWDGVIYLGNRNGFFYAIGETGILARAFPDVAIQ